MIPIFVECATNPLDGSGWWKTVEHPFQTLAACFEIKAALDSGNVETFESDLPIYQESIFNFGHFSNFFVPIFRQTVSAVAKNQKIPKTLI